MHAFRTLLKSPGFVCVSVLALALGIGANTAIFSVVYGVLLRPLPFPEQDQLLFIGEWVEQVPTMSVSYPNFVDWRERQKSFTALGAARTQGFDYLGAREAERVTGAMASHDLFTALGVAPIRGRLFSANEDKPGAERTVVIGERLWRRLFAGRDTIIGEKIQLTGHFYTVIGVMPDAFQYPSRFNELWVPLGLFGDQFSSRGSHPGIYCVARLKPGVSYEAGSADIKAVAEQLAVEYPTTNARQSAAVQRLTDRAFSSVQTPLYVLLGAAGFVLLIACANVANLQLARAHARGREFAVRAALGASRGRIIRQLLGESLLLGGLGCVAGVIVGFWALDALRSILPANVPRIAEVTLNGPVLAFAAGLSLLTSSVFGLVPALQASKLDLRESLAQGARSGGTASGSRWRAALIVGEFALTCVLLVGAGLLIRTLANLYQADPGFKVDRTVAAAWTLSGPAYNDAAKRAPVIERAIERLAAMPGAKHVALFHPLPLRGGSQSSYHVEGEPQPEAGRVSVAEHFRVSEHAFQALQIPLLAGRAFGPQDGPTAPKVAIVDTMFVERHFKGRNAVGKRFTFNVGAPASEADWREIVGAVPHIANNGLGQPTRQQMYVPHLQSSSSDTTFVVRLAAPQTGAATAQSTSAIAASMRAAIRDVAPEYPLFNVQTMDELFANSISPQRLSMMLLGTFAALALLLAAVGLYGVLTYNVGQRTREIGVRIALGAPPASVVTLILRQGLTLAALGLGIGLCASLGLMQFLRRLLYETSPFDPLSFVAVVVVLVAIGAIACWLPSRRAARVDPMSALRAD
jgi:putative ABC transport system permease protein